MEISEKHLDQELAIKALMQFAENAQFSQPRIKEAYIKPMDIKILSVFIQSQN